MPGETLRIWTVSELTSEIRQALYDSPELRSLWVHGEVSNLRQPTSGHCYFTLKDDNSSLQCVLFRGDRRKVAFDLTNGTEIIAFGYIDVYERSGQYQLYVKGAEPAGAGALHLALEQLRERLQEEGLFDVRRKRKLPLLPRTVGVVTSQYGAAFRDIVKVIRRRCPGLNILLCHSAVQGDAAPGELIAGLQLLNRSGEVDVIIIGRGGGSLEDLWSFNSEEVVRAVASSRVPVVCGVGHETDTTLCDLAADVRAPTPSAAAEMVAPDVSGLRLQLQTAAKTMVRRLERKVQVMARRWELVCSRRSLRRPADILDERRQRVDEALLRLTRGQAEFMRDRRREIETQVQRLRAMGPESVLSRGYSIITGSDGEIIRDAAAVTPGDVIEIRLERGRLRARVIDRGVDGRGDPTP